MSELHQKMIDYLDTNPYVLIKLPLIRIPNRNLAEIQQHCIIKVLHHHLHIYAGTTFQHIRHFDMYCKKE